MQSTPLMPSQQVRPRLQVGARYANSRRINRPHFPQLPRLLNSMGLNSGTTFVQIPVAYEAKTPSQHILEHSKRCTMLLSCIHTAAIGFRLAQVAYGVIYYYCCIDLIIQFIARVVCISLCCDCSSGSSTFSCCRSRQFDAIFWLRQWLMVQPRFPFTCPFPPPSSFLRILFDGNVGVFYN